MDVRGLRNRRCSSRGGCGEEALVSLSTLSRPQHTTQRVKNWWAAAKASGSFEMRTVFTYPKIECRGVGRCGICGSATRAAVRFGIQKMAGPPAGPGPALLLLNDFCVAEYCEAQPPPPHRKVGEIGEPACQPYEPLATNSRIPGIEPEKPNKKGIS
jgi:hypothetical protein